MPSIRQYLEIGIIASILGNKNAETVIIIPIVIPSLYSARLNGLLLIAIDTNIIKHKK